MSGLRSLKKRKTRVAIQDAALELFAERGYENVTVEQIAERSEVSTATFFRYFKGKADVVFGGERDAREELLPALRQAIVERPAGEDDLSAIRHSILSAWLPIVEPTRLRRHFQAAATSPMMIGLSTSFTLKMQATISEAIGVRRGLASPDYKCNIAAKMALAIFSEGAGQWARDEIHGELSEVIAHGYDLMTELCVETHDTQAAAPGVRTPNAASQ